MNMIKSGIIGMGYISPSHIDSIRRTGIAEVAACTDLNAKLAAEKAGLYNIPKIYKSADDLITDPEIQVIHNCTPNFLHKEINEKII